MYVSAAVSVVGALRQGEAQKRAANAEAAQLDYQAAVSRDNALVEARRIRRVGERARGETVAAIGASGTKIGDWSSLDLEREVMTDSETDAQMAILNGERDARGLNQAAKNKRRAGRNAEIASYFGAASSVLSSASKFGGGKSSAPTSTYDFRGTTLPNSLRGGQ